MSIFETVISLIAPSECINCGSEGYSLCMECSQIAIIPYGERCWSCGALTDNGRTCPSCRRTGSPGRVWVVTNHENLARDLLKDYKFDENRAAAESIAGMMVTRLKGGIGTNISDYLVVPVPTATKRARERGFDHSVLLARKIAPKLGLPYQTVLGRLGQSRQVGSVRSERLAQMSDKFWVKNPKTVFGRKILLIDDVVTTGATVNAASKTLRQAGAVRVDALIFAKRLL